MSDELQKNYEIFKVDHEEYGYLILKRFCHSIDQQNQAVIDELNALGYKGWVLFDQLFKGGNTSNRYGKQFFNKTFTGPMFRIHLELSHPLRQKVSQYLHDNQLVEGTILTQEDIETIQSGDVI